MEKIIMLFCLVQFLGCNSIENNSSKSKNTFIGISQNVGQIEMQITELYKNVKEVQYRFNGDYSKEVVPYIIGKNLIIPISPTKLKENENLNAGLMINLESKTEEVILDGLRIKYSDFKKLVDKGNEWASQTTNFNANHILEIPILDKIDIIFPEDSKAKSFKAIMIFSNGIRNREILLKEIGAVENQINISLKREHLMSLSEGLSSLYINEAINQNINFIGNEVEVVKKQYEDLKILLK
ncbi:MAG: hypothetical protein ACRCUA_05530 [Fusobacteriaceae bacterium]